MALRAYDFFLIFRAKSYAGSTIRRVSADLTGLGHAQKAVNAAQAAGLANAAKQAQISRLTSQATVQSALFKRRELEIDKARFDNMSKRMRLEAKLATLSKTLPLSHSKIIDLNRQIESTYMAQNIYKQRGIVLSAEQVAAEKRINDQLKLRQAEYASLLAEQRILAKEQRLAPARAMMGRGAALAHMGALGAFTGLAGTFALGGAAASAAEFDKLATQAATQVGNIAQTTAQVEANSDRLRASILSLMRDFPATAEEMSNAAYDIYSSMDTNFGGGIDLLRLFNKVAVAGMTDIETATDGAITILNNFVPTLENMSRPQAIRAATEAMDQMFEIIKFGRIDVETLNTMMNQIAPAAKAADQSLQNVGGAVATLTRRLGPGIASAGLARLFEIFSRRDFQLGMAKAGVAITDVSGKLLPLPDIIQRIASLGARPGVEVQNLIQSLTAFGAGKGQGIQATVQARRALTTLLANYGDYADIQRQIEKNQGQFNKQLRAMEDSIGVKWDTFVNQMRQIAITIGQDVIPAFQTLGGFIEALTDRWQNLDPHTRRSIATFLAFASFAALFGGIIVAITGGIVAFIGAIRLLTTLMLGRMLPAVLATGMGMKGMVDPAMTGRLAAMTGMLRGLAGIGVITIGLALTFAGDGWSSRIGQLMLAAGLGAAQGGAVGAIVIPVTLLVSWVLVDRDFRAELGDLADKAAGWFGGKSILFSKDQASRERDRLKELMKLGQITRQEANELVREWNKGNYDIPFFQVPKKQLDEFVKNANEMGDAHSRAQGKMVKVTKKSLLEQIKAAKSMAEINAILAKRNDRELTDLEKWRKERTGIIRQATEEAERILEQAADNLLNKYLELRNANEQAFGTLFEGPWMTGEEMDFAKQWGYLPNVNDLNKDLTMQINAFKRWRADLDKISKRAAPAGLVAELKALGPGAADKIAMLAKADPAQFNQFVKLWKEKQAEIDKATEADFQAQLNKWYAHGKNIAFKIIAGLESEEQFLKTRFKSLIADSFSAQFIAEQVAIAVKEHAATNPKPEAETGGGRNGGGGGGGRGGGGNTTTTPTRPARGTGPVTDAAERGGARTVHYHLDRRPGESVDEYLSRVRYHFREP